MSHEEYQRMMAVHRLIASAVYSGIKAADFAAETNQAKGDPPEDDQEAKSS